MAAIDFPTDPSSVNNEYSANGKTWVYDESIPAWKPKPIPPAFVGETAPTTAENGQQWLNTNNGQLYTWYGSAWVGSGKASSGEISPTSIGAIAYEDIVGWAIDPVNGTINNYKETIAALGTLATSHTINIDSGPVQTATLGAASIAFTMPAPVAGKSFVLYLNTGTTGTYAATFGTAKWPGGTAPTVTATANKLDIFSFVSDGTNWYGSASQNYVATP
jgi:hypothetical protein